MLLSVIVAIPTDQFIPKGNLKMERKLKNNKVNFNLSKKIFSNLMKGVMINKNIYCGKTNSILPNPLFLEIENNYEQYDLQFKMAGLEIVDNVNFFYLVDDKYEEKNKLSIVNKNKIYSAIIILVRYITQDCGKLFESLTNIHYGFSEDDFKDIDAKVTYLHLLEKTKLVNVAGMIKVLFDKGFLLKTKKDKFVLSDSGKSIVDEIIIKNKISTDEPGSDNAKEISVDKQLESGL